MGRESRVSSTQCAAGADAPVSNSNSALSAPDSDSNDDASSSDDDFRRRKHVVQQSTNVGHCQRRHKHVVQQSTNVAVTSARTGRSAFPTVRRPDSPTVHDVNPPPPPSGTRHTPHGVAQDHADAPRRECVQFSLSVRCPGNTCVRRKCDSRTSRIL